MKGTIFKLVDAKSNDFYIGCTSRSLSKAVYEMRQKNSKYNKGKYKFATYMKIISNDNYFIEVIEEVECDDMKELLLHQSKHILNSKCINKNVPFNQPKSN